jgi:hypothetical protein
MVANTLTLSKWARLANCPHRLTSHRFVTTMHRRLYFVVTDTLILSKWGQAGKLKWAIGRMLAR